MNAMMRAVVLDGPGDVSNLRITEVPIPTPQPIDRGFTFEQIREAHSRMEAGEASGKLVVLTGAEGVRG